MAESERGEQEEREERGEQHERGERREIDSPDLDEMKSRRRTLKAELKTIAKSIRNEARVGVMLLAILSKCLGALF